MKRSQLTTFAAIVRGVSHQLATPVRRGLMSLLAIGVGLTASGCQDATAPTPTGSIALEFAGLPAGAIGQIRLSKGTTSRTATSTSTLEGLDAGEWTLSASSVTVDGLVYEPAPATTTVNVPARSVVSARVVWTPTSGSLQLAIVGLPVGAAGDILVTGDNYSRVLTASTLLTTLTPGLYSITAREVRSTGGTLRADVANQSVTIGASAIAANSSVTYSFAPAAVDVSVTGLPGGTSALITLISPSGTIIPIGGTTRLVPVAGGRWQLAAASVQASGFTYTPTPLIRDTAVSAGDTLRFPVLYTLSTGALAIVVSGLPQGATGSVNVTGPAGFNRAVTATTTLTNLPPGTYSVSADSVVRSGFAWRPVLTSQQITVSPSITAAPATVAYAAVSGTLVVSLTGVPGGSTGSVRVTGPYGFDRTITGTTVFAATAAGPYSIVASSFIIAPLTYSVSPSLVSRTIAIGGRDSVNMHYASASGSLQVTVTGLPGGANAALTLMGPQTVTITGSTTLTSLAVGSYALTAAIVNVGGTNYAPTPASQSITISNAVPSTATVTYAAVTTSGSLQVTVIGLRGGLNAALTLSGPQTVNITGSTTVTALVVGSYVLTAASISASGTTYTPAPATQNVTITSGVQSMATVTYTGSVSAIDLVLDLAYLTQATQKTDGSVAMVAGRDALLRVFAHADQANVLTPTVRARIYDGAALLQTLSLTGPATGVPETLAEGTLTSTWNVVITGANVRTGTRVLVDIDPTNAVTEADEANNIWPRSGTPQTLTVTSVPAFSVRFVPVTVGSRTGNVTPGNTDAYLATTRRIWPVGTINAEVRAPFTSSADTLVSDDSNGKWLTVLSEMNTLRSVDGAPSTLHYYGVVKVGYGSGVAGYGYVPGRSAIGWDHLPSGDGVAAHEWGHNFARPHAPCGGASGADPSYPYAGGDIGAFGWNSSTNALVATTTKDIMGYCSPKWISDYNWTRSMAYRQSSGLETSAGSDADGLLVWGRVVNGTVVLEPAFRVTAPRSAAATRPTHVVEALDADGSVLLELPMSAEKVDHVTNHDERHFSVILPWSATLEQALSRVRVRDVRTPLLSASRASATAVAAKLSRTARATQALAMPDPESVVDATPAGRMRVRWNATQYPMAMVRDAATGQVMGYVRRSGDAVVSGGRRLEVVYSDGVRSVVRPER